MKDIAFLLLVAMFAWAAWTYVPLRINTEASAFRGKFRRVRLTHYIGTVSASTHTTDIYGKVMDYIDDSGTARRATNVTTDHHNSVRLVLANGQQQPVVLSNFGAVCEPGDKISVWYFKKRRKEIPFVAINHDTRRSYWPPRKQGIGAIIIRHTALLVVAVLITTFVAFTGGAAAVLLQFMMIGVLGGGWNLTRRRFLNKGLGPLWQRGDAEAEQLQRG